ncbi:MAG: DUF4097 family beta strand repeat-containing protein [Candidatus Dependentiae bacterium]
MNYRFFVLNVLFLGIPLGVQGSAWEQKSSTVKITGFPAIGMGSIAEDISRGAPARVQTTVSDKFGNVHSLVLQSDLIEVARESKTYSSGSFNEINVEAISGNVVISPSEDEAVSIDAITRAHSKDQAKDLQADFLVQDNKLIIQTKLLKDVVQAVIDYHIKMPVMPLKVSTVNGSIIIENAQNSVDVSTKTGNIDVKFGPIAPDAAISLNSKTGNIVITLSEDSNVEIDARTKMGKMATEMSQLPVQSSIIGAKLQGTLGKSDKGATISVESDTGNIDIKNR